jgi:hypothetical protein
MGARSYADLEAAEAGVAGAEGKAETAPASHGATAEAPASPANHGGHAHEEPTGPNWKGDVCQCCGACRSCIPALCALLRARSAQP